MKFTIFSNYKELGKKEPAFDEIEKQAMREMDALDDALCDWLGLLELPQLADNDKRMDAAQKLRTLLIERLLLGKLPGKL